MTISQKMKSILTGMALGITATAYATTASAQIVVTDPTAYPLQSATTTAVGTNTTAVTTGATNIVTAITTHDSNRASFENGATSTYYNDARARLDKVINALSHVDTEARVGGLYDKINDQNTAREALISLTDGNGTTFGVALPDSATTAMTDYLKRYTLAIPGDLYPTDIGLQNQLRDAQKALYYAEAIVGEVDAGREARLDVYKDLATKAEGTADVKQAIEVNNALLVENGRNLALLIHLKTAELNAESAKLRELLQGRQSTSELFGVGGG